MGQKLSLQLEHRTAEVQQSNATASWGPHLSSFPGTHPGGSGDQCKGSHKTEHLHLPLCCFPCKTALATVRQDQTLIPLWCHPFNAELPTNKKFWGVSSVFPPPQCPPCLQKALVNLTFSSSSRYASATSFLSPRLGSCPAGGAQPPLHWLSPCNDSHTAFSVAFMAVRTLAVISLKA